MFSFLKKKGPIRSAATWCLFTDELEGKPVLIRLNVSAQDFGRGQRQSHRYRTYVSIPIKDPSDMGLPRSEAEIDELNRLEMKLAEQLEGAADSIHVLSTTNRGARDAFFQIRNLDLAKPVLSEFVNSNTEREIGVAVSEDPIWEFYEAFNRKRLHRRQTS